MKHLYGFQQHLARHRRRHWQSGIATALVVFVALAALATDLASHESLLAHRARPLGIAAGAGIVLALEVGHAAVELQHG
jgi:hypothetical protein